MFSFTAFFSMLKKMFKKSSPNRGFSIVEMLIIIAIIGILAGITFNVFNSVRESARDVTRAADLAQLGGTLEIYYLDNNRYPLSTLGFEIEGASWGSSWPGYNMTVPQDPLVPSQSYAYIGDGTSYELYTKFEGVIDPLFACPGGSECGPDECAYNGLLTSPGTTYTSIIQYTAHEDQDGDTYGSGPSQNICTSGLLPSGYVLNDDDCDDGDINVNPDMTEITYNCKDDDCEPITPDNDLDGDGYMIVTACDNPGIPDCDDNPLACGASCFPGSTAFTTTPDGFDQDCDGIIDENDGIPLKTCTRELFLKVHRSALQSACDSYCGESGTLTCTSEQFGSTTIADSYDFNGCTPGATTTGGSSFRCVLWLSSPAYSATCDCPPRLR